jgi:hypothetical protein
MVPAVAWPPDQALIELERALQCNRWKYEGSSVQKAGTKAGILKKRKNIFLRNMLFIMEILNLIRVPPSHQIKVQRLPLKSIKPATVKGLRAFFVVSAIGFHLHPVSNQMRHGLAMRVYSQQPDKKTARLL